MSVNTRQQGVSIVEALVALVILSVGMLGIAGLYLMSVQSNRTAQIRTAAVNIINDFGDRVRSSHSSMPAYASAMGAVPPAAATNCAAVACTPTQVAAYDLRNMYDAAINPANPSHSLPKAPDGSDAQMGVVYTAGATAADPSRLVISVRWKEPGSTDWLQTDLEVVQLGGA